MVLVFDVAEDFNYDDLTEQVNLQRAVQEDSLLMMLIANKVDYFEGSDEELQKKMFEGKEFAEQN